MKLASSLISALVVLTVFSVTAAEEFPMPDLGDAEIAYDYQLTDSGLATLTLVAQVDETNDSLRGLRNTDRRRLSKLGQLLYQCKLMLYRPKQNTATGTSKEPVLISKNYNLYTGVDLPLSADERVGIQAQALLAVDENSLFSTKLGDGGGIRSGWDTIGEDSAINLKQLDVNLLHQGDLIESAESVDIVVRFPVFQMEKPVSQWRYHFNLKDFRQAIRHIDENCTSTRLIELIASKS